MSARGHESAAGWHGGTEPRCPVKAEGPRGEAHCDSRAADAHFRARESKNNKRYKGKEGRKKRGWEVMSTRNLAPRPPLRTRCPLLAWSPCQGTPPQTHRPLHSLGSLALRTPASERLQHRPGLRWPSTPTGSPSSRAVSPRFRCPGPPHHHSPAHLGPLHCLSRSAAHPQPSAGRLVLLRPGQRWHGDWGSLGLDKGPPRLIFTVRV